MSINTLSTPHIADPQYREDEIDLRQSLGVLLRWWREIALITLGAVAFGVMIMLAIRWLLPPTYLASASVAIARTASDVSFDERFVTTSEEVGTDVVSASARRNALLGLVTTGGIANEVILELGDMLTDEERDPAFLLDQVEAETGSATGLRTDSDLIRITITADSAEKAAAIANAWARVYVHQVNTVYGQVPDEVLASIQTELDSASQTYQESQTKLEEFIGNSRVDELNSLTTVLQQRVNQEVALVQMLLTDWQKTNEQLSTAHALRTQIENGGDGAARSNMAALQSFKLAIYGMPPSELRVELRDIPEVTQQAMLTDVEAVITSLEQRLVGLESEIAARNSYLRQPDIALQNSSTITASLLGPTYEELRQMKAQVEAESALKSQLEQQRNLDWETYKTLNNKVAELNLTRAAASSEVRFAAPAVPPVEPVEAVSLVIGIGLIGFIALFAALVVAFLADYLGRKPFLNRQPARQDALA